MKRLFTVLAVAVMAAVGLCHAAGFSTSPSPLVESSDNVVLHFDAAKGGNATLAAMGEDDAMYAHIGVYTNMSPNTWSHVKTDWPKSATDAAANTDANRFTYAGDSRWDLSLGDLRTYFGITDPDEHITTICVLARNDRGNAQTADNFIALSEDVFAISVSHDGPVILTEATTVNITLGSTRQADLTIKVNGSVLKSGNGMTITVPYEVKTQGTYTVEGIATYDGQTLTDETDIVFAGDPVAKNYPGGTPRMGTVRNDDGSVTFCMAAPGKRTCYLFGAWSEYRADAATVMNYQDYEGNRYFWTTVKGLDNSTYYPYYYHIDGSINVGDPYAHLVLDPYNDKYISESVFPDMPAYPVELGTTMLGVYRGDLDDYDWQCRDFVIPDHYSLSVYELLIRDFTGMNRRADGTLRAAIEKIPYLKSLGINTVELMPIMEFNGNNSWGYNTNFYMAPDKAYGTPDDYKEFIDKCHASGIAVVLDIVFNQSDGLHPWYQMYQSGSNPFYNASAPHKWSVLNDWNQGNALVQKQWEDAIRYWLEVYNVDGFRFDLVKGLALNEDYTKGGGNTDSFIQGRVDAMKRINGYITSVKPDAIHINELLGAAQEDNANYLNGGQMGWMNVNNDACQYAMGYNTQSDLKAFTETNWGRSQGATVSYAESHDEQRMGFKQKQWGADGVKDDISARMKRLGSVAAQMWMAPGSHMMWMFGEVGADENTKDSKFENNDTSPKPVYWNYLDDPDRKALHDNYRAMLNLRRDNPGLFSRDAKVTYSKFGNTFSGRSMVVTSGKQQLVVLLNPSVSEAVTVTAPSDLLTASNAVAVTASEGYTGTLTQTDGGVSATIPAHSFAIYATPNVTDVESITDDATAPAVRVTGGRLHVDGEYDTVTVHSVDGREADPDATLPAGIYIVSVDGHATKLLVR